MPLDPLGPLAGVNPFIANVFNQFVNLVTGVMTDQPVTLANTLTVKKSPLTVGTDTLATDVVAVLDSAAGNNRIYRFDTAGLLRWEVATTNTAETGTNAGSDFAISRYNDAGAGLGAVLTITRSTGGAVFAGALSAASVTGLVTIGTTYATGDTTMTLANTDYTAVTLGSSLVASGTYLLSCSASFRESNVSNDSMSVQLYDSTNAVVIWNGSIDIAANSATAVVTCTSPLISYSGYSGTPTILVRCRSNGAGNVITRDSFADTTTKRATSVTALRVS